MVTVDGVDEEILAKLCDLSTSGRKVKADDLTKVFAKDTGKLAKGLPRRPNSPGRRQWILSHGSGLKRVPGLT